MGPIRVMEGASPIRYERRLTFAKPTHHSTELSSLPFSQARLGFVRQFPHDLSRLLDAFHAIHGFPGPQRHRVERPGRRLVGDERIARVHGNPDIRSPWRRGLTDELSAEPFDRLDTGT